MINVRLTDEFDKKIVSMRDFLFQLKYYYDNFQTARTPML